jgi:hypothetical protein
MLKSSNHTKNFELTEILEAGDEQQMSTGVKLKTFGTIRFFTAAI